MSEKNRKDFFNRIAQIGIQDDIAQDWERLVKKGTITKIIETEKRYDESGGYSELDSKTEKDSER